MLFITESLQIPLREIHFSFIRASGPGGQHVNRSATAVQLRFDVFHSPSLPEAVKKRLAALAGSKISKEGIVTIEARQYRSQERNRQDGLMRLAGLIRQALKTKARRRPTKPSAAARRRRLATKKKRSVTKKMRRFRDSGD